METTFGQIYSHNYDNCENFKYNQKCSKERKIRKKSMEFNKTDSIRLQKILEKMIIKSFRRKKQCKRIRYKQHSIENKLFHLNEHNIFNTMGSMFKEIPEDDYIDDNDIISYFWIYDDNWTDDDSNV